MNKKSIRRQLSSVPFVVTIAVLGGLSFGAAVAQVKKSIGTSYGSRDPQACASMKAPTRGPITAALAKKYFICAAEKEEGQYLYLVENVKVQVGASRRYNPNMDINVPDIDVRFPMYPIRGSHTQYQCQVENADFSFTAPGRNCTRYEHQNARGVCYKTTFGDWRCYQTDLNIPNRNITANVAPPRGKNAPAAKPVSKPVVNKPAANKPAVAKPAVNQPAVAKPVVKPALQKPAANLDENGFVKPDFSGMEEYLEIVRYEYDLPNIAMYIVAKVKKPHDAYMWESRFYDADGLKLKTSSVDPILTGMNSTFQADDVVKLKVWTPDRYEMKDKVRKFVLAKK